MGTFRYGDGVVVEFDDRLLAHLQTVIVRKVSRGESFVMSWRDPDSSGDGRTGVWIHPVQGLAFHYAGDAELELNTEWLELLMRAANGPLGLTVVPEPEPGAGLGPDLGH